MSHNTALGSPPHVTAIAPTIISAAGAATITITGGHLSPSCRLEIPAALGTVDGPGVYTAISNSEGQLAFPITALAPPGSPTVRVCTLSNGGLTSTGTATSIYHSTAWDPEELVKTAADGWFSPAGMRGASYPTPIADGANIVGWYPNGSTSGLSKLYNGTASDQGIYTAAHTGWGSSTNWPGSSRPLTQNKAKFMSDNDGTWDRASGDDYTMALVVSPTSVAAWGCAYIRWTELTGGGSDGYTDFIHLTGDLFSNGPQGPGDLVSESRDGSRGLYNSNINPSAGGTHIFAIRRVGSVVSIYLNSATAVQTYSPGSSTATAHYGMICHYQSVVAEAVFLKYGASDAEMIELVDYWDEKYGS